MADDKGFEIRKISLKAARALAGLSASEAAEKAGLSRAALSQLEHGRRMPSRAQKFILAHIYNVPIEVLDVEEKLPPNL